MIVLAFFLSAMVMTFGFLLGSLLSVVRVRDLEHRNEWLENLLYENDEDPELLIERFRSDLDELDSPDDL